MTRITARPTNWVFHPDRQREPALRLNYGGSFLVVRWEDARRLVDLVHDSADEHDRQIREANR